MRSVKIWIRLHTVLALFKKNLVSLVMEATYNWYWLVDGLTGHRYNVHLANSSGIKQYEGLKQTNDESNAFCLARMRHSSMLPE